MIFIIKKNNNNTSKDEDKIVSVMYENSRT